MKWVWLSEIKYSKTITLFFYFTSPPFSGIVTTNFSHAGVPLPSSLWGSRKFWGQSDGGGTSITLRAWEGGRHLTLSSADTVPPAPWLKVHTMCPQATSPGLCPSGPPHVIHRLMDTIQQFLCCISHRKLWEVDKGPVHRTHGAISSPRSLSSKFGNLYAYWGFQCQPQAHSLGNGSLSLLLPTPVNLSAYLPSDLLTQSLGRREGNLALTVFSFPIFSVKYVVYAQVHSFPPRT